MSISSELKELQSLLREGTISQEEFEIAKRRVLTGDGNGEPSAQLAEIKAQNELAQLDREWEIERENYMVAGKYGSKHIPGKTSSALGGLFLVGFGIFWTVMAAGMAGFGQAGMFSLIPLFGVLFILFGAGVSVHSFKKAGQYEQAYERYRRRRQKLRGDLKDDQPFE